MKEDSEDSREEDEHGDKLTISAADFAEPCAQRLLLLHLLSVHEIILQFWCRGSFLLVFCKVMIIIVSHKVIMMIMRIVMIVTWIHFTFYYYFIFHFVLFDQSSLVTRETLSVIEGFPDFMKNSFFLQQYIITEQLKNIM